MENELDPLKIIFIVLIIMLGMIFFRGMMNDIEGNAARTCRYQGGIPNYNEKGLVEHCQFKGE